jgi:coenzyme F420-0:L-glutamate ligase/coenzyme F420-1:gamma-L-glutamate ligase
MAVTLTPVPRFPMVQPGDDLAALLIAACEQGALAPADGDVVVVAQKVVSKAEGRYVDLAQVRPSAEAETLAAQVDKDPRLVEVILGESQRVVRHRPGVLIVEHRLGFIMANAGVDRSNVDPALGTEPVLLLPRDPDASAARLRDRLGAHFRSRPAVIVTDSWGRAWRRGTVGIALGAAGGAICSGTSCASPKPDSPTRSPAQHRLSWGRQTRRSRWCWCAGCPGEVRPRQADR